MVWGGLFVLLTLFSSEGIFCFGQTIRGVSLQRLPLYEPSKSEFFCLDGSLSVPFTYVNDDYCDCEDGSDEPGTPACLKSFFYCANKGYVPKYIPSGYVNDGFCDCCDASDEYDNNNCSNTCEELGYEAKRQAEKMTQMLVEGSRIRTQMISSAKGIIESKQVRLRELETERTEAVRLRDEAEVVKAAAEAKESAAIAEAHAKADAERAQRAAESQEEDITQAKSYFDSFDTSADGVLQLEEIKTQQLFDQNLDGSVSDDELKFIEDASSDPLNFESFKEIVWPRIKSTIVMNKIKSEEHLDVNKNTEEEPKDTPVEGQVDGQVNVPPPVNEVENLDFESVPAEDSGNDEETEEGDEEEGDENSPKNYPDSTKPEYDEETNRLIEAAHEVRDHYEKASRVVQDIEREMSNLKNFLSKDYGEEDEFAPLDGQCFTYTDREYSYKLCPFDQVTQSPKSGGSETRLGSWSGWTDKNYSSMSYDKGQSCWNGPQRSTKVNVACGLENEVVSASEPNKCEYILDFKTPAACRLQDKHKDIHEEL